MKNTQALLWGALVGTVGGLIGLGGAEFRLPILVGIFHYRPLPAILINLVISLVTVTFSFLFRSGVVGLHTIADHAAIMLNLLVGSLLGAYLGVQYATRIDERTLIRVVVVFLVAISLVLMGHDLISHVATVQLPTWLQILAGVIAGVVIGVFSSLLGVAGGELIIPTIILLFGVDIKLAGSLSLAISIPTILMGLFKYQQRQQLQAVQSEWRFMLIMAIGSILGALLGSYLLRHVSSYLLHLILGVILLLSALKLSQHKPAMV